MFNKKEADGSLFNFINPQDQNRSFLAAETLEELKRVVDTKNLIAFGNLQLVITKELQIHTFLTYTLCGNLRDFHQLMPASIEELINAQNDHFFQDVFESAVILNQDVFEKKKIVQITLNSPKAWRSIGLIIGDPTYDIILSTYMDYMEQSIFSDHQKQLMAGLLFLAKQNPSLLYQIAEPIRGLVVINRLSNILSVALPASSLNVKDPPPNTLISVFPLGHIIEKPEKAKIIKQDVWQQLSPIALQITG